MKILITGGHFSPAISVIESLSKNDEVLVVGRKYSFEGDKNLSYEYIICQKLGIPFEELRTGRLQRKFTIHTIPSLSKIPTGFFRAGKIIKKYQPDIVLSFGGYIAFSVCIAAYLLKIPIIIHEQTQKAGLSNKIIARFASKICISFESSLKYFSKEKTVLTGNPIRKEVFQIRKELKTPDGKIIYITGGSAGSHFINEKVGQIIEKLLSKYVVIHQTGDSKIFNDFDKLSDIREELPKNLRERWIISKFIYPDEIGWIYKNSSLVISRAGVNTISELIATGNVCLLIPLPITQNQEQLENAKLVKVLGIGDYLAQNEISMHVLYEKIKYMIENEKKYSINRKKTKDLFPSDSDKRIINVVKSIYHEKILKKKN